MQASAVKNGWKFKFKNKKSTAIMCHCIVVQGDPKNATLETELAFKEWHFLGHPVLRWNKRKPTWKTVVPFLLKQLWLNEQSAGLKFQRATCARNCFVRLTFNFDLKQIKNTWGLKLKKFKNNQLNSKFTGSYKECVNWENYVDVVDTGKIYVLSLQLLKEQIVWTSLTRSINPWFLLHTRA